MDKIRPSHYQGNRECIDVMRTLFGDEAVLDFCRCNSFKYRFRAGHKDGAALYDDLRKAEWYESYAANLIKELENAENERQQIGYN